MIEHFLGLVDRVVVLETHTTNYNNPHQTTKAQIGLGLVENYPIATNAEAIAGTASNRYLTPANLKATLDTRLGDYIPTSMIAGDSWGTMVNKIPRFSAAGVLEVGRYIDFHYNDDSTDYNIRYELRSGAKGWEIFNTAYYNCMDFFIRSDRRDKKEIRRLQNSLCKLSKIDGYSYLLHDETEATAGVIAQEVQKEFPEAVVVTTNEKQEERLTVRPGALIGLLVSGINELNREVVALKSELRQLQRSKE